MIWVKRANYVLGIIKSTETYDNLKENLADIKTEMVHLKEIEVDNVKYKTGVQLQLQLWCNKNKTWSLTHCGAAKTCEEITNYSRSKQCNCKSSPLFDIIPLDHVLSSNRWHPTLLNISDNLLELLIRELKSQDAVDIRPKLLPIFFCILGQWLWQNFWSNRLH